MRTAIVDQAYEMCFALDGGCLVALPSRSHRVGVPIPAFAPFGKVVEG